MEWCNGRGMAWGATAREWGASPRWTYWSDSSSQYARVPYRTSLWTGREIYSELVVDCSSTWPPSLSPLPPHSVPTGQQCSRRWYGRSTGRAHINGTAEYRHRPTSGLANIRRQPRPAARLAAVPSVGRSAPNRCCTVRPCDVRWRAPSTSINHIDPPAGTWPHLLTSPSRAWTCWWTNSPDGRHENAALENDGPNSLGAQRTTTGRNTGGFVVQLCRFSSAAVWRSGNALVSSGEVSRRQPRSALGWVTVSPC